MDDTVYIDIQKRTFTAWNEHGCIMRIAAKIQRKSSRIHCSKDYVDEFDRLDHQEQCECNDQLVACSDERNHEKSANTIYEQDVSVVEQQVKQTEHHQKNHSPHESWSEIHSFLCLIVMLDIEAKTEEHREDGVHLAGKPEEGSVEDGLVQ